MPSPDDIAGLWVRYKADDEAYADGATATTVTDISGNARDGTGTGLTLQTVELNGRSIYRLDGVDDEVAVPSMAALTQATVFIVIKIDTDPPGSSQTTGLWDMGTAASATHFPFTDSTVYDAFGTTVRKTTVNPTPALTSWRVYCVVTTSGEWSSYLDGTQLFTTGTNTVGFPASPKLGHSAGPYFLDGDFAEFIVYDSALPDDDDNMRWVEQYVWDEYGVGVDNGLADPVIAPSLFVVQSGARFA